MPVYTLYLQVDDTEVNNTVYNFTTLHPSVENAGFDLVSGETWASESGELPHLLNLGVRAMMVDTETKVPVHYWLLPRSSIYKTGHMMANSVGVIDSSYRGVLKAPVVRTSSGPGFVAGQRYFQIVAPDMGTIVEVLRVSALPDSVRGEGGFGSTG
jgi:dUTPase